MTNIYLDLTQEFNTGALRAIISSGQAVVLHRLAIMSKDGDWIVREEEEALAHVLGVLERHGASYRFGAPLDLRWMRGGWSAHFEFRLPALRVRTDFVTRPPRLSPERLADLWENSTTSPPVVPPAALADLKKTNREKDYAVIGELARLMRDAREELLYSRSARDLSDLQAANPQIARDLAEQRPLLGKLPAERESIERELDAERRGLIRDNEVRLERYRRAAAPWAQQWPETERGCAGLPLREAHVHLVARALELLPCEA